MARKGAKIQQAMAESKLAQPMPVEPPPFEPELPEIPLDPPQKLWTLAPLCAGALLFLLSLALPVPQTTTPTVAELARNLGLMALPVAIAGVLVPRIRLPALLTASVLAFLSFRLRECAFPLLSLQPTEPLRASVQGLTIPLTAAVALGGLLAWQAQARPIARTWLGLGLLGLAAMLVIPQGWLGQSLPPLWCALAGLQVPQAGATVQLVPGALQGSAQILLAALVVGLGIWTLRQKQPLQPQLLLLLLGLLALTLTTPLLGQNSAHALAGTGALLLGAGTLAHAIAYKRDEESLWPPLEWLAVLLLTLIWLVLKVNGTRYSTTDEALYYYAARLWTEGKWPYRDFFFSHPPLHIAVPAIAYSLFGYSFALGKWISVVASFGAALAVWRIARRILGIPAGILALAFDLFAAEVLQASTNLTGVNLTTCWMMWGVWAVLSGFGNSGGAGRFLLGGALLGAAAATGFYALGMMLAMVTLLLFVRLGPEKILWKRLLAHPAIRVLLGFLAVWGTITLLGTLLAGEHYLHGVFSYHFAKKAKIEGFLPVSQGPFAWINNLWLMLMKSKDFTVVTYYHAVHLWLALLAPLGVLALVWLRNQLPNQARKKTDPTPLGLLINPRAWWQHPDPGLRLVIFMAAAALVAEFGQFKERYDFYWALILPLLSIGAAGTLQVIVELGAVGIRAHVPALEQVARPAAIACGSLALLALMAVPVNNYANIKAYPTEFRVMNDSKGAGEVLKFEWLEPPVPPFLGEKWAKNVGELTRAAFWSDSRIRGNIETGVHHYLWNKKRWYSTADEMAAWIRDHSQPDETITGASDYAPLLALLSGRRLAGDHVDTNSKVFDTGAVRLEDFWDAACKDKLKYIVIAPMSYFAVAQLPKRATIIQHFRQEKVFHDPKLKHWKDLDMELWVRKTDAPCKFEGKRGAGPSLDE